MHSSASPPRRPGTARLFLLFLGALSCLLQAAPYQGETFTYRQPDGETFSVKLFGDEFFAYEETTDGYLVVRDPKTGEFCYARVTKNGTDLVSTGIRVGQPKPAGLDPKLRLTGIAAMEKSRPQRDLLGKDEKGRVKADLRDKLMPLRGKAGGKNAGGPPAGEEATTMPAPSDGATGSDGETQFAPPTTTTLGERRGLVLLASFPDRPEDMTKTPQEIDRLFNDPAYADGSNATSVYGYFDIQSGGKLKYTNAVTAWFTAKRERAYYTDESRPNGEATRELINEGLSALSAGGFDFSQCDADNDGVIDAVNCLYAGQRINAWTKGLWPQQSSHSWAGFSAQGLSDYYQFQISDMPAALTIGTIMHESGHMICDYPDLYNYIDGRATDLGNYSLMSGHDARHPQNIDPYLKIASGWANVIDLNGSSVTRGAVQVGSNHFYRFRNPSKSAEYFLIEARGNIGYEGPWGGATTNVAPTSGLVVYHALQTGSNTGSSIITGASPVNYSTPYELMLVEAAPVTTATPWYTDPAPGTTDGFKSTGVSEISDSTLPELKFWSSSGRTVSSNMRVHSIGAAAEVMGFSIGTGTVTGPAQLGLTTGGLASRIEMGANAPNDKFAIFNSGSGTINYTISDDAAWISVTPTSGTVVDAELDTCTVAYSTNGLAVGTHIATITVASPDASNSPRTITVTMIVDDSATVPVFTTQPTGAHLLGGQSHTLVAVASGTPVPSFAWYRNGVSVPGASSNLVLQNVTAEDAGTYHVVAFNSKGQTSSNSVVVTVNDVPSITRVSPVASYSNLPSGMGVVLDTQVTDDGYGGRTLDINWTVESAPPGGVVTWANQDSADTTARFTVPGAYQLRITASDGISTVWKDYFFQTQAGADPVDPTGLVVHYTFDETSGTTANDSAGISQNATLLGGATFSGGELVLDGTSTGRATIASSTDIDTGGPYPKRTIMAWVRRNSDTSANQFLYEQGGSMAGTSVIFAQGNRIISRVWKSYGAQFSEFSTTTTAIAPNTWFHIAVVLDATPGVATLQDGAMKIYINGQLLASGRGVALDSDTNGVGLGGVNESSRIASNSVGGGPLPLPGRINDFRIYNRALGVDEIGAMTYANNFGPIVDAGPAVSGTTSLPVALNGTVSDDGMPSPSSLAAAWSIVSGPGTGGFNDSTAVDAAFTGHFPGIYTLRLAVNDGRITTFDETTCTLGNLSGPGVLRLTDSYFNGAENLGTMPITVERPLGLGINGAVSVSYSPINGTALNGTHYLLSPGTLSWANQEAGAKTIHVEILDNTLLDGRKSFTLQLTNPTGGAALATPASAVATITDNELPVTVILQDTFNTASTTINTDLATRQSGTLATSAYTVEIGTSVINANRLKAESATRLANDADLESSLTASGLASFSISFDLANTGTNWVATYLSTHTHASDERGSSRFGMHLNSAGNSQVLQAYGDSGTGQAVYGLSKATLETLLGSSFVASNSNAFSFVATPATTTTGTYNLYINGVQALSNIPYKLDSGGNNGKISWENRNNTGGVGFYDNLSIQVTPQPPPNQAPAWITNPVTGSPGAPGTGYSGTLAGAASDPDGDPLFFTKISGPAWLSVASDGSLSGTPGAGNTGLNSFTVGVSDGLIAPVSATLNITVTTATISVPTVTGLARATAESQITSAGLVVGTITSQYDANVPTGNIISQNPPASTTVNPGSAVNLVISLGTAPDTVPLALVGLSPNNGSSQVPLDANLVATFDEPVTFGTGMIALYESNDQLVESFDAANPGSKMVLAGTTLTIDPSLPLENQTGYYVRIANTALEDAAGNAFAGINDSATWSFITMSASELLFFDDFDAVDSSSLTTPGTRASGSLAAGATYAWSSTTDVVVNGTLNWDSNGNRNGHHQQPSDTTTQNVRLGVNFGPKVAGKIWEVEFNQRVGWSHPLTFGLSDTTQTGLWSAWNDANYDFAAGAYGTNLFYDADTDGGGTGATNPTSIASVFPTMVAANAPSNVLHHFRIRFDEPNGTATIWINGVQQVQVISLDFESSGRYLSWGEPTLYAGALDNLSVKLINANSRPVFAANPINGSAATEDVAYTATLAGAASDVDGETLTYAKVSGPAWLGIAANGALSGTPSNSDVGANTFAVSVSDGIAAPVQATLNITVNNTNDAPVWVANPVVKTNASEDAAYSATLAADASDLDAGTTLTFAKVGGPSWLGVAADGTLSGTPANGDVGTNTFTINVSDGIAPPVAASLAITVTNTNDAPVWASNPVNGPNASEDSVYSATLASDVSDADAGATLTFAKVSGPSWLGVGPGGTLSGTPSSGDVGTNNFTISVSDGIAAPVEAQLNITVAAGFTKLLLFHDDFNPANGTSLTNPASRATGTLAASVRYAWTSTTGLAIDGTLNWDHNNSRNSNNEQTDAAGAQNLRVNFNWAPHVAGKVWEVEFNQRVGWSHPLTFALSDTSQNGAWNAWDVTGYDFAAGSYGPSLRHDTENEGGANGLDVSGVFPAVPNTVDMHHVRIRFDEPASRIFVWINGDLAAESTALDFESPGRFLSWGEPLNYAGALDNLTVSVLTATNPSPPTYQVYAPIQALAPADQGFASDPDMDGLSNGLETWFGTHPGQANPGIALHAANGHTMTLTHPRNQNPPANVHGFYQWSPNLTDWYDGDGVAGPPGGPAVDITSASSGATTTVTATMSQPSGRIFLRAGVLLE